MAATTENSEVPLSPQAQEAKESMHQELMRNMANKMFKTAIEEERQRRIKAAQAEDEDSVKKNAYEQLMVVQEDLVRTLNLMRVKAEAELEQAQRITEEKKHAVHDELLRKSAIKEADRAAEEERKRRIEEADGEYSQERKKTYNKLVTVQEDLLKTISKMKAAEGVKLEQERRIMEGRKNVMQEELIHSVGQKNADIQMEEEKTRRVENLSEEEIQRRVAIAHKMIDVQKELLATHKPLKPIEGTVSQEVLEEAKAYFQEQLLRKAAQKEAIAAMDKEQKRRISEGSNPDNVMSDARADMLEAINRRANVQKAKDLVDSTQQDYIQAEAKARVQEETVRKVNQKIVDRAMDKEKDERMKEQTEGKEQPHISKAIKEELSSHSK